MSLQVCDISFRNYRSLRSIRFPLDDLTVFLGGNGTGRSILYRGLQLIQAADAGSLTREGGMEAALWAGDRRRGEAAAIEALSPTQPRRAINRGGETWLEGLQF